jgi:hypothetical protein
MMRYMVIERLEVRALELGDALRADVETLG